MGVYNFTVDLPNAERVVDKFEKLMQVVGYKTLRAPNYCFPDWDIKAWRPLSNVEMTFEVKYDEMSAKTGNVAIEYESRGKLSGISTTTAKYWVQYFDNAYHSVLVSVLKQELPEISHRKVVGGDAGSNTKMYLIRKEKFKEICVNTIEDKS